MKLIWLSDIHLEFPTDKVVRALIASVAKEKPDAVLITGDISSALKIDYHLGLLATLACKVYFVLGNHDFYEGSFASVEATVKETCRRHPNLIHLGAGEIVRLTDATSLIGHRGWADGRAGLGSSSTARLNDHLLIQNLVRTDPAELFAILNALGEQSAEYIRMTAAKALLAFRRFTERRFIRANPRNRHSPLISSTWPWERQYLNWPALIRRKRSPSFAVIPTMRPATRLFPTLRSKWPVPHIMNPGLPKRSGVCFDHLMRNSYRQGPLGAHFREKLAF
jgi:predicted phosphohydrolase